MYVIQPKFLPSNSDDDFYKNLTSKPESTFSQIKTNPRKNKILPAKQLLQRLPILLARVNTGNISDSLLNEIRQIDYSLYQAKLISKQV